MSVFIPRVREFYRIKFTIIFENWSDLHNLHNGNTDTDIFQISFLILGDGNAKVGNKRTSSFTEKNDLTMQSTAGDSLMEFC